MAVGMGSIGSKLKEKREKSNISLQKVHLQTRISTVFLEALEQEKFDVFPAEVYLIGFLKKYAQYLGFDPDPFVSEYRWYKAAENEKERAAEREKRKTAKSSDDAVSVQQVMFLFAVIFICFGIFVSIFFFTAKENSVKEERKEPEEKIFLPSARKKLDKRILLELSIRSKRRCWVRVEADNTMIFEGLIPAGASQRWNADTFFKIIAHNWDDITIALNGDPITAGSRERDEHVMVLNKTDIKKNVQETL